jgi:hypothetical protein
LKAFNSGSLDKSLSINCQRRNGAVTVKPLWPDPNWFASVLIWKHFLFFGPAARLGITHPSGKQKKAMPADRSPTHLW